MGAVLTTDEILDSIENRLRELRAEIETLNAARGALQSRRTPPPTRRQAPIRGQNGRDPVPDANEAGGEAAARDHAQAGSGGRSRAARRPGRRKGRTKARRSVEVVPAGKLELLLSGTSGLTTSELADRASGDRDQVLVLLRELEAAGRVRRTGERRGTRWHVITDEDRIRERAAELAALSERGA
jgi:hypothetical protein